MRLRRSTRRRRNEPEYEWQCAIVRELRLLVAAGCPILFASDLSGVKLSRAQASKAKAGGMEAGETDLRIYMPGGELMLLELKGPKTVLSGAQKARHARLRELGFQVRILRKASVRAPEAVRALLADAMGEGWSEGWNTQATRIAVENDSKNVGNDTEHST